MLAVDFSAAVNIMSLHKVTPGPKAPEQFNVVIEIPMNADPIKYEVDKESGALFVDRFMTTAMHYPCNYGYVPQTLADDGDPVERSDLALEQEGPRRAQAPSLRYGEAPTMCALCMIFSALAAAAASRDGRQNGRRVIDELLRGHDPCAGEHLLLRG